MLLRDGIYSLPLITLRPGWYPIGRLLTGRDRKNTGFFNGLLQNTRALIVSRSGHNRTYAGCIQLLVRNKYASQRPITLTRLFRLCTHLHRRVESSVR